VITMVEMYENVEKKIKTYCSEVGDTEIGGLIIGEIKKDGVILIEDIIILKQKKTGCSFEVRDEDMMDFTKNCDSKTLGKIIGWWHSHATMNCFWSGVDEECTKRLCKLSGFCVAVVVSSQKKWKSFNYRCMVMMKNKNDILINCDNVDIDTIENLAGIRFSKKKLKQEVDEKVEDIPMFTKRFARGMHNFVTYGFDEEEEQPLTGYKVCKTCSGNGLCPKCEGSGFVPIDNKKTSPTKDKTEELEIFSGVF